MAYKAVLFDMDGTVLDTLTDLENAANTALRRFGLPEVPRDKVRASLGNGAERLIRECVPAETEDELIRQIVAWYRPWYEAHCCIETCPYPGIVPLMERLKARGIQLAIISNKADPAVRELAERFFPGLLETAVGESKTVRCKPDPDAVLAAAKQMGRTIGECVYVGDTEIDVATARNAGMDCLTVSWGFRSEEQLFAAGARSIAHTAEELEEQILA